MKTASLLLSLLLCLAGCSLIDPHNMIGRQMGEAVGPPTEVVPSPRPATMSAAERGQAFDFVWGTINDRYYDRALNGVDWKALGERYRPVALAAKDDETFWDTLDKMAGELKDAHTRVESPTRVALRKREETLSIGFGFAPIEGRLAVTSVSVDSDAYWAGLRTGMSIARIDGEPAMQAYERLKADSRLDSTERSRHFRAVRRLLSGEANTPIAFTFERTDGTTFDAKLSRRTVSARSFEMHRVLPSGYGYVRFTEWTIGATLRAIKAVEEMKDTPGLVIDLRGNPGGAAHAVNLMLEKFFPKRAEFGQVLTRTGKPVSLFFGTVEIFKLKRSVEGDKNAYDKPVVIITNAQSASASELFAGSMQAAGRAKVVGEPSCGCLLGFLGYARIPGGGELAYSEVGFVLANGKRIEGEGVIPDRPTPVTLTDLRANRDRALEEAQAMLATMKPWTS
jgi:carboxyl-terminal processing protease